jgi:hypothetical protein
MESPNGTGVQYKLMVMPPSKKLGRIDRKTYMSHTQKRYTFWIYNMEVPKLTPDPRLCRARCRVVRRARDGRPRRRCGRDNVRGRLMLNVRGGECDGLKRITKIEDMG